ncbi:hypothetical protein OESDEN_05782 [Oesophagostomum dentatum]|uniref:CHK kinase-like domain-containing protein n=1 Tax=Oesophagostomum dentatum TaxID=61180 RepID=A0A0B1T9Q4_OESDE|nr:hypothetical protein OESDEN_05782 [Oesophagostomum dentatum]
MLKSACNFSDGTTDQDSEENQDYLCGTDVSLQWLLQILLDKFNHELTEEPQWIVERLNRPKWDEPATSTVLRVTFGWEEEHMPRSVIVKTPASKDIRDDEVAKYHYVMFKRECNIYDWTKNHRSLPSPAIYHIKRHAKDYNNVVVMEDASERGVQQDANKGLSVDAVRDLLRRLATLHTVSMKVNGWTTMVSDLPNSYYSSLVSNFNEMMNFFEHQDVDHSRFVETAKYFSSDYLKLTSTEAAALFPPKVFVHGEPYASNVFLLNDTDDKVGCVIDWTGGHAGCYGEDIAKAICWNLSMKVTATKNKADIEPMIERAKGLIQNAYTMSKLDEESI